MSFNEESDSMPRQTSAASAEGQREEEQEIHEQQVIQEEEEIHEEGNEGLEEERDVDALVAASAELYGPQVVNEQVFEHLVLAEHMQVQVQEAWANFLRVAETKEAAGEAIFTQIFEYAPAMEKMFKTPRAILAMRFMHALTDMVGALNNPKALQVQVETVGFQHLEVAVSPANVGIFRDAIADLLTRELGARFNEVAAEGLRTLVNYVGGALIFIRVKYAERLRILATSWATANSRVSELGAVSGEAEEHHEDSGNEQPGEASGDVQGGPQGKATTSGSALSGSGEGEASASRAAKQSNNTAVPQTFNEMFQFNSAVMGFAQHHWMNEVLERFDDIVTNVSNSYRMQEECELLSIVMGKYTGTINLYEFKAVMLASLRSLVPKDWNSAHEVAWSWLWENIERMLQKEMGKPKVYEKAVGALFGSLDEHTLAQIKKDLYASFFVLAPAGMDIFKQSKTRLDFVADKALAFTAAIYKDPKATVRELSALGLKHVGWGIPTELFPPFVTANVNVVRAHAAEDVMVQGFQWAISLVSRIITRVINEGSTIVMKAINANSARMVKKAIGCAPRGKRATWMLSIQVGTESISPLVWAVEVGAIDAAREMLVDLLSIRADREAYYYGMDEMFRRHPDIIKILGVESPELLPILLDGLIWRSRVAENGMRRVNYFVKYMIVDTEGNFSRVLEWVTNMKDPKTMCHPCIAFVTDLVWSRVVFKPFLLQKMWFVFTLGIFVISQSVLKAEVEAEREAIGETSLALRAAVFCCRVLIYVCSLGHWVYYHTENLLTDIRSKDFTRYFGGMCPIPTYLQSWQSATSFLLTLVLLTMFATEPLLHCMSHSADELFTTFCPEGESLLRTYSVLSFCAMLLYFVLVLDCSVFSTRLSAFVVICARVMPEVFQFFSAVVFFSLSFAAGLSCLQQFNDDFAGMPMSFMQLIKITTGMFRGSHWSALTEYPLLFLCVTIYVLISLVFMTNVLIAQLNCLYHTTYEDMVGFARLRRGTIVVNSMATVSQRRWQEFAASLRLDERCEFGEGDIGLAGAIQVQEPASANRSNVEMIKRYGGSTSPTSQWPEDTSTDDANDRVERMEKLMENALKKMASASKRGTASGRGSSAQDSSEGGLVSGSGGSSGGEQ